MAEMIVKAHDERKGFGVSYESMLGIDQRVLRAVWTVFLFALALLVVYAVRRTLVLFLLAIFLATLLAPVVDRVHWLIPPSGSRGPAIAIVYLAVIGILVGLAIPIGSRIADEAVVLARRLPSAIQGDPLAQVPVPAWLEGQREQVNTFVRERMEQLSQNVVPMLSAAGEQVLLGLGSILSLILIPILSFFALKDGIHIRRALLRNVDPGSREMVDGILMDLHRVLAHYMRALLLLALATFVSLSSFFTVMGVPFGLLLAGIAATLEIIPAIGPLVGATTILLVAALTGFHHMLVLLLFLAFYRLFLDYVLSPFLMSEGVEVHPLLVLFGVLAGEQIGGVPGMFFSVPVIAALRVIVTRLRKHERETA
jgi:predicted PurR-regulated permease PerM